LEDPPLTKTKAQLKRLGYPTIGIQLYAGNKVFGRVEKFTPHTIYLKDKHGDIIDVPRRLIARAMLLLEGENVDVGTTIRKKDKSPT